MRVCITVDLEPDCPPQLSGFRGMEHGAPRLLDLLKSQAVPATLFATAEVARRYPGVMDRVVSDGHELGSHGSTHTRFSAMDSHSAAIEIDDAHAALSQHGTITSFRAPNLDFPAPYLDLLQDRGYTLDSSEGRYKPNAWRAKPRVVNGLRRVPTSTTPSVVRLPRPIRNCWLARLASPVVLFFHPWEFVDLTREKLRIDCRFNTGEPALASLRETIEFFRGRGATFIALRDLDLQASD